MQISAASFSAALNTTQAGATGQNQAAARAVRGLNAEGAAGPGRTFSYSTDPKTNLPIIRIVDAATREVVDQVPVEYILQMAQQVIQLSSKNTENIR